MASTRNTTSSQEDSPADFKLLPRASSASTSGPDVTHPLKRREPPSDTADDSHKRAKSSIDASKQSFQHLAQTSEQDAQFPRTFTSSDGQVATIARHATNAMAMQPSAAPGMNNTTLMPFSNGLAVDGLYANYPYAGAWASGPPSYYSYPTAPVYHGSYGQVDPQYPIQNPSSRSQSSVQSDQDTEGNDLRANDLQGLDALSDELLCIIGDQDYEELDKDCARGHEYGRLKESFEGKMEQHNIQGKPFIDPHTLGHLNATQAGIVRKANLAACMSSIFGSRRISLDTIQEHFQDVFVLPDHALHPWQCDLLLAIKTQACIEALTKKQGEAYSDAKHNVIRKFFPEQVESSILAKRNAPKNLVPSEKDFVKQCEKRRQQFLERATDFSGALSLQSKYSFTQLLDKVHGYIPHSVEELNVKAQPSAARQYDSSTAIFADGTARFQQPVQRIQGFPMSYEDHLRRNMVMANAAINGPQSTGAEIVPSLPVYQAYPQVNSQQRSPFAPSQAPAVHSPSPTLQSAPTQALFDQARRTTSVRAPPSSRKSGVPNQRRAWSLEEERALLDGLDQVKGPHWSQILTLFGKNGTASEVLKERNQVQLKDKARNLKLFFLKSNVEVPFFLQGVTGDLRTRAPAQAAKLENAKLEEEKRRADAQAAVQSMSDDRMMEAAATLVGGARWTSGQEPYNQISFSASGQAPMDAIVGHGSGEETHPNEHLENAMTNSGGH